MRKNVSKSGSLTPPITVGIMLSLVDTMGRQLARGIMEYGHTCKAWEVQIHHPNAPLDPMLNLATWPGQGILAQVNTEERCSWLQAWGGPVVNVSSTLAEVPFANVLMDNVAVGKMAAQEFLRQGFQNFAYVGMPKRTFSNQRREGYVDTLTAAKQTCNVFEEPPSASFTARNEALRAWLVAQPKPLAIFCANDYEARRVVIEAIAADISIPMQVAVLGVDDDELESIFSPVPLSSVVLDFARVGYRAAELLTRLMAGKAAPKKPLLVPPLRVVQRRSSDVLAIGDPIVAQVVRYMWDHLDENLKIDNILACFPSISRRHFERR
ncbi:MAG: substrate-binding domain-containing protein, partial [Phycisphaerae bacterium]